METFMSRASKGGVNPKRAHFNAGTAQDSSGASFAQELRAWLYTQKVFTNQLDLAAALDVSTTGLQLWLTARAFPSDPLCDKLDSITHLNCFSQAGRDAARAEHEQKRGLSRAAIYKRGKRQYITPEELEECLADPEKAFTIRGDAWLICLECGQLLKQIRSEGAGAHLPECCGKSDEQYRELRYGKNRPLICNELSAKKAAIVAATGNLKPGNPPRSQKGREMSAEWLRKQRERRGTRRSDNDARIVRLWLLEAKSIEQVASELCLTRGAIHGHLRRIFGARVKDRVIFSRGDLVTDRWVNRLGERFGHLSKLLLGRLLGISGDYLQDVGAVKKNRALTCDKAERLVSGEGRFLEALASAEGDRADYLRVVVPDLRQKRDGAVRVIKLTRDVANGAQDHDIGLHELCGEARKENVEARIALAWLPQVTAWFASLEGKKRSLSPGELARIFLAGELNTGEHVIKEALSRSGPVETKPGWIRHMIVNAFREKALEAKLAARAKGGAPKKEKPESVIFGEAVLNILPRFERGRRLASSGVAKLRGAGFSDLEIDCIISSRNARTAAIRWICKRKGIEFGTGKNYLSSFLSSKKRPTPSERHE